MKGFRFRLERLLELRQHALDRRRRELALAEARFASLAAQARAAEQRTRQEMETLRRRLAEGVPASELCLREQGTERMRQDARQAAEGAAQARQESEASRQSVQEAERAARVLERLRERMRSVYRQQRERAAQRELDEVGAIAWSRREETR